MKPERGRGRARNNMAADISALSFSKSALLLALRPLLEDTIALANGQPAAASWHMPRARLLLGQDYCRRTGDGARAAGPSSTALDDLLPKPAKKVRDGIQGGSLRCWSGSRSKAAAELCGRLIQNLSQNYRLLSIRYKCRMIRLTDEQWERTSEVFPRPSQPGATRSSA